MAIRNLPYYPLHVADFDEDEHVMAMTLPEVGLFILALNAAWKFGSIPDDYLALALLIRRTPADVKKVWLRVRERFVESDTPGRLVNTRQERERLRAIEKSSKAATSARSRHVRTANAGPTQSERSTDDLLRASKSNSFSPEGSGEGFGLDCRALTERLWQLHPEPAEFNFVEAALANEKRNASDRGAFDSAIIASLTEWVAHWAERKRYPTGLRKWIESGDYARKPISNRPTSAPSPPVETPEQHRLRLEREDAIEREERAKRLAAKGVAL